jgi:hypothetical protein
MRGLVQHKRVQVVMNLVSLWWISKLTLAWNCTKCSLYKMHYLILVTAKFSSLVLDKTKGVCPSFWKFCFLPIEELPPILAQRCITRPPFKSQHHIWANHFLMVVAKSFSISSLFQCELICSLKLCSKCMWLLGKLCVPNSYLIILEKQLCFLGMWKFNMSFNRLWVFSNDINNILSQMTSSNNLNVGH